MDPVAESAAGDYDEGPSMALHRVRFVDWSPSAVTSIAFLQGEGHLSSSSSSSRSVMAVGHENGNISLCIWVQDESIPSPSTSAANGSSSSVLPKGWQVDTTLVGATPSKVDTLAFLFTSSTESMHKQPRLFSTSGGSIIVEHTLPPHLIQLLQDTGNGLSQQIISQPIPFKSGLTRTISSQGGSVWCMAASPLGRYLAIGCEDGHVRIIDIQDNRFELLAASRSARRAGDGSIEGIVNTLDRAKTRIVSLAWGAPRRKDSAVKTKSDKAAGQSDDESDESSSDDDDDEEDWEESFILGGTTHSSALIWSTATGRVESKVLVDKRRNEQTIVWSVAILRDGTLVLGDSLGHVSLFDGKNRTLLPSGRFANHAKGADVLAVCVGTDGKTVYSAGLDQKVIEYALVKDVDERKDKWICTGNRRLHAHDIRALAMDPPFSLHPASQQQSRPHSYRVPILVSGGSDFSLVYTPASSPSQLVQLKAASKKNKKNGKASAGMRQSIVQYDEVNPVSTSPFTTFADTIQRRIPFVPSTGRSGALGGGAVIRVCASRGWVLLRRETSLGIWRLPQMTNAAAAQPKLDVGETAEPTPAWTKLLEMQLKVKSNIVCADISNDGRYLAVADLYETKLYVLQSSPTSDTIVPERIKSFGRAFQDRNLHSCPGSSAMAFTPDNTRLILASQPGGYIHVVELPSSGSAAADQGPCRLLKSFDQHRKRVPGRAVAGRKKAGGAAGKAKSNGHSDGDATNGAAGHHLSDDNSAAGEDGDEEEDRSDEQVLFSRIDVLQISPDGQYLVSVDTYKRVHTFSLDTLHFHRSLPSVPHVPSSIAFDLSKPGRLCLILPTNQVILHNLEERANNNVSSSKEDQGLVDAIMERIITIRESAIGAVWLTSSQLIVWGSTWICTARAKSASLSASTSAPAKRGRSAEEVQTPSDAKAGWNVTLTFKYQPLLHVGLVASASASASGKKGRKEDELIVVERPYYDIARTLPPSWFSGSTYGT